MDDCCVCRSSGLLVAVAMVVSKGVVVVVGGGRNMEGRIFGRAGFLSLSHHRRINSGGAVGCRYWGGGGCERDDRDSVLDGFGKSW